MHKLLPSLLTAIVSLTPIACALAQVGDRWTDFENSTSFLDSAVATANEQGSVLLVVSRLGDRESKRISTFRLQVVRCYLARRLQPPKQAYFVDGAPCPGRGRIELYVGGKLFPNETEPMVLYMPRNGITNLWGEDPIAILNPRNVRKANVSCVFDEKNYFERRPTSDSSGARAAGLIGYPWVDRARPLNLRVGPLSLTRGELHVIIALILLISLCGGHGLALHAPSGLSSQAHSASPRDVSFRELAASPTQFDNQRIRLRAVWRVGEEWSDLYWPGINPGQCVLVDFNDNESTCTSRSIQRRARANEGSTFGIVLEGTFHNQAAGTVSGGCPNWIDVDCIKKLDVILPQASPTLSALSADQRRLVESWCNRGD